MASRKPVIQPSSLTLTFAEVQVGDRLHFGDQRYPVTAIKNRPISQTEIAVTLHYDRDGETHLYSGLSDIEVSVDRGPVD